MDAGISLTVDARALDEALMRLRPLEHFDAASLMEEIAALGESQTRRRITDEKTAPDGTPWAPNREGTPILHQSGQHLLASVAFTADGEEATWGAAWEFAHIHQDGATILPKNAKALIFESGGKKWGAKRVTIPARPFIGLSADNREEIEDLVSDHFGRLLR